MIWIKPAFPYRWDKIICALKNIKWFGYWCQNFFIRGAQGWCYDDTNNLSYYLLIIIPPILRRIRDTSKSYPAEMTEEIWKEKLNIMLEGFKAAGNLLELAYFDEFTGKINQQQYNILRTKFDTGMKEFHNHFFSL